LRSPKVLDIANGDFYPLWQTPGPVTGQGARCRCSRKTPLHRLIAAAWSPAAAVESQRPLTRRLTNCLNADRFPAREPMSQHPPSPASALGRHEDSCHGRHPPLPPPHRLPMSWPALFPFPYRPSAPNPPPNQRGRRNQEQWLSRCFAEPVLHRLSIETGSPPRPCKRHKLFCRRQEKYPESYAGRHNIGLPQAAREIPASQSSSCPYIDGVPWRCQERREPGKTDHRLLPQPWRRSSP